ncbi:midasin isoform X2 [Spodoptera litura]|uniref:Midasin n=1 Tax=Spodoptera litura TaxID=69820 RepID=A0A9J7DQX4_SPOLT|nr:midasin isoform X2 [Spodoptera litura]
MSVCNMLMALKAVGAETKTPELTKLCEELQESINSNTFDIKNAVTQLSEYILKIDDAKLFKKYLSSILLALVSAKIPLKPVFSNTNYETCSDSEKNCHLEYSIILAALSDHPDILQYALKYFEVNPVAPFEVFCHHEDSYNVAPKKRRLLDCGQKIAEKQIIICCYTLLKKLPNEMSVKWDWTKFVGTYGNHGRADVRWMIRECMAILANMTDTQQMVFSVKMLVQEYECHEILEKGIMDPVHTMDEIVKDDLSPNVVNIDGILLPIFEKDNVQKGNLVPVKSTVNNLRSLALAVASGQALSLMGPVGSGKTSLVEHLAAITGRKGVAFKKVQLGDQTDSRMLLGSHQCTDIPGEFVWRPGVLTEAVQNGHWLLLEDIDCAALDVASTLSSLLERNALCVPGYRDSLPVTPGFQLFVTQRTLTTNYGFQKKMSNSSTLLQKHLTQINVEPLSRSELAEIIQALYPALTTICSRMIEVFMMFSVGSHDTSLQTTEVVDSDKEKNLILLRGSRLISTRDLLKWCSRAVVGFDVSSPESALKVLQDALDIFTCSVSSPEHRLELSKKIGLCLGIVEAKSEFYCKHYKPNVSLTANFLEVGRSKVPRVEKSLETIDFDTKQTVFSFTRQSACLLERIACCVTSNEPVLLVGETGTGKTSSVQYIARQTGNKLVVINMNQQSDSADLLGGYKPVDLKYVIRPIRLHFEELFRNYYNVDKNKKFLGHIETCYETENWTALLALMKQSQKAAVGRLTIEKSDKLNEWVALGVKLQKLEQQIKAASKLTFAFIEGSLVKAMQEGHWVLLDEINLASAEILECLAGLLEDKNETIDLLEKGDKVPIKRHPNFTLFACMNPATDVGKKDLPAGLRNRFTEFFIDELNERNDLMLLIGDYLYHMNLGGGVLEAIYTFYASIKKEAKLSLVDGSGNTPHYSLRTLCRALTAAAKARCGTVSRSLYEAFCLSFLTQLDSSSHPKVEAMIAKAVIGKKNVKSVTNQLIPEPQVQGQNYLLFEGHWIPQGKLEIAIPEGYILTPTVRKNLRDIARIISLGRLPILLQGDTSVGKTSLITYIAKASGNYCVRINNHEHTDLQEYIGSYATDSNGKLVFKEGVLVEAMRKGYWIILDELNLAPSDVLEALNRVLDDNRELFIPETQQVVKADPNFMLFATQNPPGLYGGRKMLSRAFRNRFVELHFDEIPKKELETILHQRCHVPPAYSKKMIAVMADLQIRRRGSAAVQGKDGFITLRDLFRWGQRYKCASKESLTDDKFYDWDQHIADEGYLILAGKVRQTDERSIIEEVIEKHIKRKVNPDNLFTLHPVTSPVTKSILETILNNQLEEFSHVVWTYNMRRLAVLIAKSFSFDEPVLLVGETGCGKTTICQVLAALKKRQLLSVNCHMHTESSDFLGGLRPVRQYQNDGRLFEWVDGPLIKAMETGNMFLADEISLADDSVLERMNSLLEPERQLVLAERGMENNSDIVVITANKNFHFIGTMNPGGDFGKKELSPALRNRFTEIWCDSVTSREDLLKVLEKSVHKGVSLGNQEDGSSGIGTSILNFTDWLKNSEVTNKFPFSIRDLLSWVNFINTTVAKGLLDTPEAYVHGACMTFLDCFGTALTGHIDSETLVLLRKNAINLLLEQIKSSGSEYMEGLREMLSNRQTNFVAESGPEKFGIKPFYIEVGQGNTEGEQNFTFTAPTTGANTLRLLRGLQLNKAILLEGNPGVGKTSLVTALAKSSGHKVVRINLSDQTDITDLFGTDLPTEDGSFMFKEGAFLSALQNGDWILLDELNLAPQPVLEGLNACLDHRGEVFIPELGRTFKVKDQTRLFACQNPLKQGGARRGLPVSFLNRFTQVYIDTLTKEDLIYIVESQYSSIPKDILHKIVEFNCKVAHEVTEIQSWGHRGAPWEMNLRDIQRWCEAIILDEKERDILSPGKFVDMLYVNRMRTQEDKEKMIEAYDKIFLPDYPRSDPTPQFYVSLPSVVFGDVVLNRKDQKEFKNRRSFDTNLLVLRSQLPTLKAVAQSIKMNWLTILVGPTATGKSSIVQVLADLTGNELQVIPVTSAMDVSDLLGGFEQVDFNRNLENLFEKIETLTLQTIRNMWIMQRAFEWKNNRLLTELHEYQKLNKNTSNEISEDNTAKFNQKIEFLIAHCEKLIQNNERQDQVLKRLHDIVNSLKKLQNKVSQASSVNAGGKFEFVDSLLVKTMIEGSWLLLDNVNLTSAAVLDRLNGLLEPNGVLSIPERGEFSEIKPHPNFRVFFTMDPKYGEISRAMRNRGVEISLLRPDELQNSYVSETENLLDLTALLSSCGLPTKYHDLCIKCHELMQSFVEGLDRPTISHLLQAAHLTWQQLLRGISATTAIVSSFSDVYIKPRCGADFASNVNASLAEMKNSMLKALEEEVNGEKLGDTAIVHADTFHTTSVKGFCRNTPVEIAKQLCYIAVQETKNSTIESPLHVMFGLYSVYQRVHPTYFTSTYGVINNILKKQCRGTDAEYVETMNDICFEMYKFYGELQAYKKYYPELYSLEDREIRMGNREALTLYNNLITYYMKISAPEGIFTVANYSNAVIEGKLTDDFPEYPILKFCQRYLAIIDEYISIGINRSNLDDETACHMFQLLSWRERFFRTAHEQIFAENNEASRRKVLRDDIVPLLYAHSKWLQKHLMLPLLKLTGRENVLRRFNESSAVIAMSIEEDNTEYTKLSKKLRKSYGQPKLLDNQTEYDACIERSRIYNKISLDLNQPISKQLHRLSAENYAVTDMTLALDVPDGEKLKAIQNNLDQVESKVIEKPGPHVKILPIISYVVQRVLTILQRDFLNVLTEVAKNEDIVTVSIETSEVLASLVTLGKVTKGFPQALLNLMEVLLKLQNDDGSVLCERISSLPIKFWDEYYKAVVYSPAFYPSPFLAPYDPSSSDDVVEEIPVNSKRLSNNLPLLPYYLQKFTVSSDNAESRHLLAYEAVAMEDRTKYSMQLGTVLNVLWKNIATLDCAVSIKLISDAKFEMKKYEQLINFLYSALDLKNETKTFEERRFNVTENVRARYRQTNFDDILIEANIAYDGLLTLLNKNTDELRMKMVTTQLSVHTSVLITKILSEIVPMDRVAKYRLKVKYIDEDIKMFDALLSVYYFHGIVTGSIDYYGGIDRPSQVTFNKLSKESGLLKVHPHCRTIMELRQRTIDKVAKYKLGNTFRPEEPSYISFANDCKHFTKSVLSSKTTQDITTNLINASKELYGIIVTNSTNKTVLQTAQRVVKETSSWLYSVNAFYKKIETYSEAMPDLAKPLQSSISQLVFSITSLNDLTKELIVKIEQGSLLKEAVHDLMVFPNDIPNSSGREAHLNRFLSMKFSQLLARNVMGGSEETYPAEVEVVQVLKMNLLEIRMHCTALDKIDRPSMEAILTTLNALVKAWEQQQKEIEKKKQDDEALYVTKSKCEDEDEEAMALEEMMEMFPSYSDQDFAEFKPPTLEQVPIKTPKTEKPKQKFLISPEDITLVYKWHSNLVRNMTSADWLPDRKKLVGNDVVSPFLERYPTFSRLIDNAWEALDAEFEGKISPSLMVLIAQIKDKVDGEESSSKVDFYRSAWVSETKQCVPLLHRVKENTNELLDQWPDFPTLKEIIVIVNRILSFPVTSPVSRFLTGLELLRDKIEEWNKNAHKGNNMIEVSLAVGQQIINWRKLEMAHWKECLNNLYNRKQSEAHKYWFYLYSVISSYLDTTTDPVPADRVITVLKDFMEKSNLAEYEIRLDIIFVYHCHLVHLEASERRDELLAILWNTYNYYAQFSAQVAAHIKEKRAPIEKKLRDFVKICTWDRDLSYWSVKDTVEKAHKALHKHTKEFENVLKESVTSCIVDNSTEVIGDHVGIWDRPKRTTTANAPTGGAYMIDVQNYMLVCRNIKRYISLLDEPCKLIADGSLLLRIASLLDKTRALCKDTITNTGYPSLVQALDDFVTIVIETSQHLGSLEVDASLPKEKQTSQAKNFIQQKRKALADLFKYLTKLGLNYRTGLVIIASGKELYDFTIPPVDLEPAVGHLKSRRCDTTLSLLWSGCEKYFQKNIARHRTLTLALQSPHQDLGMQNIERLKGFAAQLLKITNTQKKSISKYSRYLCDLRNLSTNLIDALDFDDTETNVSSLRSKIELLVECYANTGIVLEQFNAVLKSCPEKGLDSENEPEFDSVLSDSKIVRCYKNTDEWRDLNKRIKALITNVNKQKNTLHKISNDMPKERQGKENPLASQTHANVANDCKVNIENMINDIDSLLQDYQFKFKLSTFEHTPSHPLLKSINKLVTYLKQTVRELVKLDKRVTPKSTKVTTNQLVTQTEDLVATMLLIVQSVYKKHLPADTTENAEVINAIDEIIKSDKEEPKDIVEDKHLKEHLQDKLSNDTRMLQLESLINKTQLLYSNYVEHLAINNVDEEVRTAVMRAVPILEQTVLFVQYFVTQKVSVHRVSCKMLSVLLKIFSDLASKGFCKPSDLDMDEAEGEGGSGKFSGGMGLGEGEGQKDVSERIENQDQLDDARQPGEEKKEDNRDCKEEEKGVNMTDDFDSHLQDVDKKDGEQSDQEDDEDDADKQMGDIDNAADKLDQQIWGSEDEEELDEEEQGKQKDKEEKGKGESTGEKEMSAKDDQEQGADDGADGKDKKKKKDINEMEEPELDDDQTDPYHGNQQPLPEPEDFELPENMDVDGDDPGDDEQDGETETENPFDIDVMKENIPEEPEKEDDKGEDGKDTNNGLDVSDDEEDGGDQGGDDEGNDDKEKDKEEDDSEKPSPEDTPQENEEEKEGGQEVDQETAPEETETPEVPENEEKDLPKNPEKIEEEDEVEQKNQEANPQANPSNNDPTAEDKAENAQMEKGTDDNVETNAEQNKEDESSPYEQVQDKNTEEKQSTGRSELDKSDKGHRGEKQAASHTDRAEEQRKKHENKPGKTDQERTLGDVNEKKHKQAKTLNVEREDADEGGANDEDAEKQADAYQHVKQANKDDLQAIDAATKEQADEQPMLVDEEENAEPLKEDEEVPMDIDEEELQVEKAEELKPEKMKEGNKEKEQDKSGSKNEEGEEPTGETGVEVEGEVVVTAHVPRGTDTTYHTRLNESHSYADDLSVDEYMSIRQWLASGPSRSQGTVPVWRSLWRDSSAAARALCERLRLVLEPTGRSRKAGDFRTGRSINMRRVIPYIASHFRKDRIWLRRTKPAKREYKIAIAVDDSSSMSDNRSKELAFESLALVSQALNLLESGDLAVLSFGEKPNLLHPFTEQFSEHSGSKILEQLRFEQTKTKIAQLLDFCTVMFEEQTMKSDAVNAKLLVIVSDGRGIFSEGETRVMQAVRRARQQGIFLVYVIIDNPDNKDSIMDIRRPLLDPTTNALTGFVSYLDTFPFPFYLILRDMSALPTVLGDALRQWFELAANTAN